MEEEEERKEGQVGKIRVVVYTGNWFELLTEWSKTLNEDNNGKL